MKNNLMTVEQYASNESFQAYCLKTDEEAIQFWTNYLATHPDQVSNITEAKKIVEFLTLQVSEEEIITEKEKMKPHFNQAAAKAKTVRSSKRNFNLWRMVASVAAVGLVLLIGSIWLNPKTTDTANYITQTFPTSTNVELSDGSTVYLAAGTSIKHEADWKKDDTREIWLKGKAFFDVRKNPLVADQKFIVNTRLGTVEVLGTSFTIDDAEEDFEIVLETGKLAFHSHDEQSIVLVPNEKVFFQDGSFKKEKVNTTHYALWKEDRLVFEDAPINEIVTALNASFNLDIKVESSQLLKRKITASIPKNDPELLLQALSEIYDIKIIRSKHKIILK